LRQRGERGLSPEVLSSEVAPMGERRRKFVAAAVQYAPELPWDLEGSAEKCCHLIDRAAAQGAELIVFPECFLPMYPNWSVDLANPTEWAANLAEFTEQCPQVPGPATLAIGDAARRAGAWVVVGANARHPLYGGKLFNALLYFAPTGEMIGLHRKLLPTNREKVFHSAGDGRDLAVYETDLGRLSGLICYEHLQPLAKYALFAQGEEVHCACWPGWPDFKKGRTNVHVVDAASRACALEGQVFVVLASLYVPPEAVPRGYLGNADWSFFGGSGIIGPDGNYLAGPLLHGEGIVTAEVDLRQILIRKAAVDTMGKDSRWDILRLQFEPRRYEPLEAPSEKPEEGEAREPSEGALPPAEAAAQPPSADAPSRPAGRREEGEGGGGGGANGGDHG
ncbi:MAG: carbon-nitrogen hydrolase family protein, partial [Nitrospinota bacterium]